jgi:FtsH-binding integral membrane protein
MGTRNHISVTLATIGLFAATGAIHTAQADAISSTLYTGAMRAGLFGCNVVNVSNKTLTITISLIDPDGQLLSVSPPTQTPAGTEVSGDFGDPTVPMDAYCKVQVSGTGNRDDIRVVLTTSLIRTFNEGSQTNIPAFVVRQIEGH